MPVELRATPPASRIHYLALGHLTRDLIPGGACLGGTVAYAALTARALGCPPGLFTACDRELDLSALAGIPCIGAPSLATTTFENSYGPRGRTQYLRAQAAPLDLAALPVEWLAAPIVHIGPVAHEVSSESFKALATPERFVGLTPQGWLRQWDAAGRVYPAEWEAADELLPLASAVVASLEDLRGDWQLADRWAGLTRVLVITQGPAGCTVFAQGAAPRSVPAPRVTEVDPTGAGDIFAAAFFIRLRETRAPYHAAEFATALAAQSVTRRGLAGVPTADEAAQRRAGI